MKRGFTLAEVLITITVIGIVAAITLPTLLTRINNKVKEKQIQVIEKRLIQGLNMFNSQENGLSGYVFNNSREFLEGLSKYYKMTSICDSDELERCWPYKNINYETIKKSGNISVRDINLAEMRLDPDSYYEPAGFISASGVPYIVALKKNCIEDPDVELKDYSSCISGMFDYNGTKVPNKFGSDIKTFGDATLKEAYCIYNFDNLCVPIAPFYTTTAMANFAGSNCEALKNGEKVIDTNGLFGKAGAEVKLTNSINQCPYTKDHWLASKLQCENQGLHLPSESEILKIKNELYDCSQSSCNLIDANKFGLYPYPNQALRLWVDLEISSKYARNIVLYQQHTTSDNGYGLSRDWNIMQTVCISK